MLHVSNLFASYGAIEILRNVTLHVDAGERVTLIGANGSGKSTLLKVLSGLQRPARGEIWFQGQRIDSLAPERIVGKGLLHVPEDRQLFSNLTVEENLELGGFLHGRQWIKTMLQQVFALFPVLAMRRNQPAGTLSGGEQQMLSIARALMGKPSLLVLDEPSLGLAPLVVDEIFDILEKLNTDGTTIFLVEQNALAALEWCDRAYVLEAGRIVLAGRGEDLLDHDDVQRAYLGKEYREKWER